MTTRHGASIPTEAGGGGAGGGSLSSVDVAITGYTSNGPLVADGTITMTEGAQSGNKVKASPADGSSGTPAYRALAAPDIPSLVATYQPLDADLTAIAALATTSVGRGLLTLASPSDATKFLNGAATPAFAQVKDADLATTDVTTNNVSTSKHGFHPKLDNTAAHFMDMTGSQRALANTDMDTATRTRLYQWAIDNPVANSGKIELAIPWGATVLEVASGTDTGTVTFNIEERTTRGSSGTNLLSSSQVADNNGESVTSSFNLGTLTSGRYLCLVISAVASSPGHFEAHVKVLV